MKAFLEFAVILVFLLWLLTSRERRYQRGVRDGYELGRREADNWWTGIEQEVEFTRASQTLGRDPSKARSGDAS